MKAIWGIVKKELDKIINNPRLFFSSFILPGLIIFGVYAFMGQSIQAEIGKAEEHIAKIAVENMDPNFITFVEALPDEVKIEVSEVTVENLEDMKASLLEGTYDAYILYEPQTTETKPNFVIYYNQLSMNSSAAMGTVDALVTAYEDFILAQTYGDLDVIQTEPIKVGAENKEQGQYLAMLLPMLVITFVFSGALSVGADAIAGEKERGTLATLLMAPISKNQIITGKIISTTIITVISAISSFIGVLASLPFASALFNISGNITYGFLDYLAILLILLAVALIAVCLILLASTLGRTIKEATMYAMPVYIVAILSTTISMFSPELPNELFYYFIPIYNHSLGLKGILSFSIEPLQFAIIIGSTAVYFVAISIFLVRLFKNERVLFAKQ